MKHNNKICRNLQLRKLKKYFHIHIHTHKHSHRPHTALQHNALVQITYIYSYYRLLAFWLNYNWWNWANLRTKLFIEFTKIAIERYSRCLTCAFYQIVFSLCLHFCIGFPQTLPPPSTSLSPSLTHHHYHHNLLTTSESFAYIYNTKYIRMYIYSKMVEMVGNSSITLLCV